MPAVCLHIARFAEGLGILCSFLIACGACSVPIAAQDMPGFGQLRVGPLLDDGEAASWLDEAPDRLLPGNYAPGLLLVVDEPGPNGMLSGESGVVGANGLYQEGMAGGDAGAGGGMALGRMGQCSDWGVAGTAACPGCSPVGGGEVFPGHGVMGLGLGRGGLIARWSDLLEPMTQESWLNRPLSAGWFMGFMQGSELVEDWVGQEQGFFGGYRFGWDTDRYWGWETRLGFASVALYDSARAKAAQAADDLSDGLTPSNPYYYRFDTRRDCGIRVWDVDMLWYPFGDTYLRPYFLVGLGTARVDFMDRLSERRIKSVFAMPIGLGFKYRLRDWVALRVEATDNFIAGAGSGFKNLHNFSLTAGLEVRFGGARTGYWPYYPGRHYW
jgi:hypothetical protein